MASEEQDHECQRARRSAGLVRGTRSITDALSSEAVIRAGARELAAAVGAVRAAAEANQPSPGTQQSLAVTGSRTA
jgi:hypothetical protein